MALSDTRPSTSDRDAVYAQLGALLSTIAAVQDPLHRLDLLRSARDGVDRGTDIAVAACRDLAVTWELIADGLGLNSRQAAQARYGGGA
jgi:hypothetical protein